MLLMKVKIPKNFYFGHGAWPFEWLYNRKVLGFSWGSKSYRCNIKQKLTHENLNRIQVMLLHVYFSHCIYVICVDVLLIK